MSNPINLNNNPADRVMTRSTRESTATPAPARAASTTAPGDTVSLTSTDLLSAGRGEIDVQKVARIRQDIQAGRYDLDPEAIAQKLLAFEGDLVRES